MVDRLVPYGTHRSSMPRIPGARYERERLQQSPMPRIGSDGVAQIRPRLSFHERSWIRTHYSTEFRAEAVRLAETSCQSIRQVAMDLGISNESLRRWIAQSHERPAGSPLEAD